jgi:hypothetical protein
MFLREVTRRNKNGSQVSYLQLVHNEWDAAARASRTKIVHSFGRSDQVDLAAVRRLIDSLSRLLDPAGGAGAEDGGGGELAFVESRPVGGVHVLDGLWRRLGIDERIGKLAAGRKLDPRIERVLFALVANRALDPASKLAAASWVSQDVHIDGLPEVSDDACYRAMDWLLEVSAELEKEVFWQTASLFDLEIDVLFFDTTSTYFEIDEPDVPVARDERGRVVPERERLGGERADAQRTDRGSDEQVGGGKAAGFRAHDHSKDHRPDLPQVIVGMAVTRTGIPVRCWCWPGNTADATLIRQVKDEMRDWTLARIVWVADRGFASADNRRYLRRGDHHYILGEKLRSGSREATAALSRQGRYTTVAENLRVKEVRISEAERFVIAYNPEAAARDAVIRDRMIAALTEMITGSDKLSATKRAELRGRISTMPGLNRYLRTTPGGLLRIDHAAIKTETNLDGKFLLRCSDPSLSAADIATGYKQLLEVERGWRDMKQILDLRPVYHRKEDRIRAHVILCWLALLLIRIIETTTGATWRTVSGELNRLHTITFTGPAGTYRQTTEPTPTQRELFAKLGLQPPKKIIELTPTHA